MNWVQDLLNALGPLTVYIVIGVVVILALVLHNYLGPRTGSRINRLGNGISWILFLIIWAFPAFLWGAGYLTPSLHTPATLSIPDNAKNAVMFLGVLGGIWLIFEMLTTQNTESRGKLMANVFISALWAMWFCGNAGYKSGLGTFQMWEAIPMVFSSLDLLTGIIAAIVAAWNKNPTQVNRSM